MPLISELCPSISSAFSRAMKTPAVAGLLWLVLFVSVLPCCVYAQMVTGSDMGDFAAAFENSNNGWSVQQMGCSLGANALWPDEEVTLTFFIKPGQALEGESKVDVVQYGSKGTPGDWWKQTVFKIAETSSSKGDVDLASEGGFVTDMPKMGGIFGGYALIFDLGERGRAFGATLVRVPAREWMPTYADQIGEALELLSCDAGGQNVKQLSSFAQVPCPLSFHPT